MLSHTDKEFILSEFPNIKLSYENIIYKKVYNADMNVAIPEGIKCFAWFTTLHNNNCCLIMELNEKKQIKDVKIMNACFSSELSYGTILYGTVFYHLRNKFFCIEDIFSFKGKPIERENWGDKLFIFKDLIQNHLKQVSYNNSFIIFGLPVITNSIDDMIKILEQIKYKISFIQFRSFHRMNNYLLMDYNSFKQLHSQLVHNTPRYNNYNKNIDNNYNNKNNQNYNNHNINNYNNQNVNNNYKNEKIVTPTINRNNVRNMPAQLREFAFIVKPDIQNDIYHLHCFDDFGKEEYIGVACISDYKTSVMMNKLFRNIKENNNLDALEESDDEEEFENDREDKFVYLDRSYQMVCQYNYKFKKWSPIKLSDPLHKVAVKRDLQLIEKK